jgi:hypothetical protein
MGDNTQQLKEGKMRNFKEMVRRLQEVMRIVDKNTVTLKTSEPIGPGHNLLDGSYHLFVTNQKVFFIDNLNRHIIVDDNFLLRSPWFQVYVYIVEMELVMERFLNHLNDSLLVVQALGD